MKKQNKVESFFRFLIYILPGVLFFSYYPLIHFGSSESMNFEISLPIIWLVIFDMLAFFMLAKRKLIGQIVKYWAWLIFPIFLTISVLWSLNVTRGILTVGILWLIYFAVFSFWRLKDLFNIDGFREKFWKVFFGSTLVICVWCFVQCILDLVGVSSDYTLMCAGCTYHMFGFPHPNGFAIEPQFMGNLLIAPAVMSLYFYIKAQNTKYLERKSSRGDNFHNKSVGAHTKLQFRDSLRDCCKNHSGSDFLCSKYLLFCSFIITTALFLTFSRGAIYAFVIAMVILTIAVLQSPKSLIRDRKLGRTALSVSRIKLFRALGKMWLIIVVAFAVAINVQGVMAEVGPTNDTYKSGVAKVINHLSLGVIDLREQNNDSEGKDETEFIERDVDEKNVNAEIDNGEGDEKGNESMEEAVFDGYVAESTDTRLRLSGAAVKIWSKDFKTVMFGVGLGGAGQALYNNGLSPAPKEIVQNEYVSLLLETGLIGIMLFAFTIVLIVRVILENKLKVPLFALMVAYGITLIFFSGLPNALQIYLLPMIILSLYGRN